MTKFFINRPIVAMVISIITVIVGLVIMLGLPTAQFPEIIPPEILVQATHIGADALTVEQSVATPIEQQMSGVDNMLYMYSINANNGSMAMHVNFDIKTDPNTDQILAQLRTSQAESQLPVEVRNLGVTVQKSASAPLVVFGLYSPDDSYDAAFLANYAYINLNDQLLRVPGVASLQVFGAGQYAMRFWVKPDQLAKFGVTIPDIIQAVNSQNKVNPAGQIGGEPVPAGQEYTYTVLAQGRLVTEEEFRQIVIRAEPDGSVIRLRDVAHVELGSQYYNLKGRLNGKPAAIITLYQLPGSNAIKAVDGAKALMAELKQQFPADLDYVVALDTTQAVRDGIKEIIKTLFEALALVILVVFIFLQGWRATLIPLLAVPVSLIGTFIFFPLFGFSINTLSLFGLVLAIGLVVDDAIVVVEAVERHIEAGLSPKAATHKAMQEVSGPVVAIALILAAVFIPTIFIPGITGRLYQQFAVTIAVSVLISAFNALSLSPALAAMLLRPRQHSRGPLSRFFAMFNRHLSTATNRYVAICALGIRKTALTLVLLLVVTLGVGGFGKLLPGTFIPEEDLGYMYLNVQLPHAASIQRTDATCRQIEEILARTPGLEYYATVCGYSMLSQVQNTYSAFFFISLQPWEQRRKPAEQYAALAANLNRELSQLPQAQAFVFPPPAIPGIGTAGGVTFLLEDRAGKDVAFLAEQVQAFIAAARQRPEIGSLNTTFLSDVPQVLVQVDREKVLKQGVDINQVYQTIQAFMGGCFINYFNRFGRQWQIYLQADGDYRARVENMGQFYVRNDRGAMVPLSTLAHIESRMGPESTMRFNLYRCAQFNASAAPGYSSAQVMRALEEVFATHMPREMGYDYLAMSFQEKQAQEGVPVWAIFGLSLLFVFLILAAQYESWSLPFSVLLGTPIAVCGAFLAIWLRGMEVSIYVQIGLIMLIGLAAKNAILIIEFAKTGQAGGLSAVEAALQAARIRLRPILMTALAFIMGCVPLWVASGSGAVSRQVLGTTVIGGMLAASAIAIFIIPVSYSFVQHLIKGRSRPPACRPAPDQEGSACS